MVLRWCGPRIYGLGGYMANYIDTTAQHSMKVTGTHMEIKLNDELL
jgi:hypothetical protein